MVELTDLECTAPTEGDQVYVDAAATQVSRHSCSRKMKHPTPILEHDRLARSNRICLEDLEEDGRFDIDSYPPLFLPGSAVTPAALAQICNRGYTGLKMSRKMTPGVLKATRNTPMPATGDYNSHSGHVVFGRSKPDRAAFDNFHGREYERTNVDVEISLGDGSNLVIDAVMWRRKDYTSTAPATWS